eukprot:TRINITY_DN34441_c0_g1_i2.p1 TRINITY_DN34441_c0_g1~~TRINITY_DN34441_c0_g1_i2.p1  ORF type:complete len:388 (-),score=46.23 TRINITY_DN34441_c0_g1_i2:79-1242(-)
MAWRICYTALGAVIVVLALVAAQLQGQLFRHPEKELPECEDRLVPNAKTFQTTMVRFEPSAAELADGQLTAERMQGVRDALDKWGVAVIHNVISKDLISALRKDILQDVQLGEASPRPRSFIMSSEDRHHIMFDPREANVSRALEALGVKCSSDDDGGLRRVGFLSSLIPCGAHLVELASIVVKPGAIEQGIHPDTKARGDDARLITAFVYLQKTTKDNGALWIRPRSHSCFHEHNFLVAMPAGGVILMDSRTFHKGGSHTVGRDRAVFYVSWIEPRRKGLQLPLGSSYALRRELWGRMQVPLPHQGSSLCCSKDIQNATGDLDDAAGHPSLYTWGVSDPVIGMFVSCNEDFLSDEGNIKAWFQCQFLSVVEPLLTFVRMRLSEFLL